MTTFITTLKTAIMRRVNRIRKRRHDKLRLWIMMAIGVAIPTLLFWTVPNVLASWRARVAAREAAVIALSEAQFSEQYAALIAQCERDPVGEPVASVPDDPRVVVVQYHKGANVQSALPEKWQPTGPEDVSVVVCLGREAVRTVDACGDGAHPDLSPVAGYEIDLIAEIYAGAEDISDINMRRASTEAHPEFSGTAIRRYAIDAAVYDAQTGELIAQDTLWGGHAEVCEDPFVIRGVAYDEILGLLTGDRVTVQDELDWLAKTLE